MYRNGKIKTGLKYMYTVVLKYPTIKHRFCNIHMHAHPPSPKDDFGCGLKTNLFQQANNV